jgi:hypothetical protein
LVIAKEDAMADLSPKPKICCICGKDVAHERRTKDEQGNYICAPCFVARHAAKAKKAPPIAVMQNEIPKPAMPSSVMVDATADASSYDLSPATEHNSPTGRVIMPPPLPKQLRQVRNYAKDEVARNNDLNSPGRQKAASAAFSIGKIGLVLSVAVPIVLFIFAWKYTGTALLNENMTVLIFKIVIGFWIYSGIYGAIGYFIREGGMISVILGMILGILAFLGFSKWVVIFLGSALNLYGREQTNGTAVSLSIMGVFILLALMSLKLAYHAFCVLIFRGANS